MEFVNLETVTTLIPSFGCIHVRVKPGSLRGCEGLIYISVTTISYRSKDRLYAQQILPSLHLELTKRKKMGKSIKKE